MFNKILVCLDGSRFDESILSLVAGLAERFTSRILLLNVLIVPALLGGFGEVEIDPGRSVQISGHQEEAAGYLKSIAGPLLEKGLDVECIIVEGSVEESIIACARAYEVSLVALVTYSRGVLSRLIRGSTIEPILRKLGIPVLLINPKVPAFNI
jgi:nucleotide-binding universal stress UspA family protein